jgi:hypothetical protein
LAKSPKKKDELAPVPFNTALKRVWASPPQHKTTKKKAVKKKK